MPTQRQQKLLTVHPGGELTVAKDRLTVVGDKPILGGALTVDGATTLKGNLTGHLDLDGVQSCRCPHGVGRQGCQRGHPGTLRGRTDCISALKVVGAHLINTNR